MEEFQIHSSIFPALLSLFLLCCIAKRLYKHNAGNKNLPPSPPRLPILGNLHQLGAIMPRQNLQSLAKKYRPLMLLRLGRVPVLVVSSADAAREILKTHGLTLASRPQCTRLGYDATGVAFAPYGEYWRQGRKMYVLQLLSHRRVQSFRSIIGEETALFMKKIRESSGPVNLSKMFTEFTNNGICRSAFGRKFSESGNGNRLLALTEEISEILGTVSIGEFIPWLSWIDRVSGSHEKMDKVAKELDSFLEDVIQDHLESPKDQAFQEKNGENFLNIMLEIYKGNAAGFSIERHSIKRMILDIFAAGTDTTSTSLEWAMTELLRHPSVMEKLQKEVREIAKGKQVIASDNFEKMHYLKAVIKETLRYHPPLPSLIPRMATGDAKVQGYDIPAGTVVIIDAGAIGRDPASWDEPEKFRPERFLNSSIDFKGLNFELIPFGAGRRACPGIAFADANIELMLANLVHKFNWRLPDGGEGKDLDMSESHGITAHRVVPLLAVAAPIE